MVTATVLGTTSEILDTPDLANNIFICNSAFKNFHKICRFCLGFDNLKPFFDMTYKKSPIPGIIFECSSLKTDPKDHLPYNLCLNCIAELIRCYNFKKRCIQVTSILLDAYNNRNSRETEETVTRSNNSRCYGENQDNLIIKNEEIIDAPSICSSSVTKSANNGRKASDPADECYRILQSELQVAHDNKCNIKSEVTAIYFNDSECYGGSQDNLIIKNEEIADALTVHNEDFSDDKLINNTRNCLDPMDARYPLLESKIAESTNTLQGAYHNRCYIKTEQTSIQFNESECYAGSQDNLIKIERTDAAPIVCYNNLSEDTSSDTSSDNNTENDSKNCLDSKDGRTDSKLTLCSVEDDFDSNQMLIQSNDEKKHECGTCRKTFAKKGTLKRHVLIHTGEKPHECNICKESFVQRNNFKQHMLIHTGETAYRCSVCEKSFVYKSYLKQHMLIHTGEREHKCSVCNESFVYKSNLKQHMLIHTGKREHKCSVCKESFVYKTHLTQHMLIHTGKKPYECDICKKSFMYEGCLKQHMLIHNGAELYECSICKKSFSWKHSLEQHMYSHTVKIPLHECDICKKSFANNSHFKQHMVVHTGERPHKCSICRKSYNQKGHLIQHMVIHTGEKPHECSVCKKAFTWKPNLTAHMRIHTGEKPFDCNVCNRSFTEKRNLNKHLLLHEGEGS